MRKLILTTIFTICVLCVPIGVHAFSLFDNNYTTGNIKITPISGGEETDGAYVGDGREEFVFKVDFEVDIEKDFEENALQIRLPKSLIDNDEVEVHFPQYEIVDDMTEEEVNAVPENPYAVGEDEESLVVYNTKFLPGEVKDSFEISYIEKNPATAKLIAEMVIGEEEVLEKSEPINVIVKPAKKENTKEEPAENTDTEKQKDSTEEKGNIEEDTLKTENNEVVKKLKSDINGDKRAFSEKETIDDMTVTVQAESNVFTEGAKLSVEKVNKKEESKSLAAVNKVREKGEKIADTYTFDIKVVDKDGNEIQPNGEVLVSFSGDMVENENLIPRIYHIDGKAEELSGEVKGDTVSTVTDGFSYYTVEFTYDKKTYIMEGDTVIPLKNVLDYVDLSGEVEKVWGSNDDLFSFSKKGGEWYVSANDAFLTTEWMKVIIDGVEYEIVVTDATYTMTIKFHANGGTIKNAPYYNSSASKYYKLLSSLVSQSTTSGGTYSNVTHSLSSTATYANILNVSTSNLKKTGYHIVGTKAWNTKADGTGVDINQDNTAAGDTNPVTTKRLHGGTQITSNVTKTIYANWIPNEYTITFDPNGGKYKSTTGTTDIAVTYNDYNTSDARCPGRAVGNGYRFKGWYTARTGGTQVYDREGRYVEGVYWNSSGRWIKAANVTVYAQWETDNQVYAVLDLEDGSLRVLKNTSSSDYTNEQVVGNKVYFTEFMDGGSIVTDTYRKKVITAEIVDDGIAPTSTHHWFYQLINVRTIDIAKLNTSRFYSRVYDAGSNGFNYMFANCVLLERIIGLNQIDTSTVESMSQTFRSCKSLKTLDLSNWDTSSCKTMDGMFSYTNRLKELDISGFDTSALKEWLYYLNGRTNINAFAREMFKESGIQKIVLGSNTNFSTIANNFTIKATNGDGWVRILDSNDNDMNSPEYTDLNDYNGSSPGTYARKYSITFDPNEGTYNATASTTNKTVLYSAITGNSPGKATRNGYFFKGWYTSATGGTQIFDTNGKCVAGNYWTEDGASGTWKGTENITVYAQWERGTIEVYDNNGILKSSHLQLQDAVDHAVNGDTIKILSDIDSPTVEIDKKLTIRGADDAVSTINKSSADALFVIKDGGEVILGDNLLITTTKNNVPQTTGPSGIFIEVEEGGKLTLDGENLTIGQTDFATNVAGAVLAPILVDGGEMHIVNGEISQNRFTGADSDFQDRSAGGILAINKAEIYMSGGSINGNEAGAGAVYLASGSEMHMSGGAIENNTGRALNATNKSGTGGVYVTDGAKFFLEDEGEIKNNTGYKGGGVFVSEWDAFFGEEANVTWEGYWPKQLPKLENPDAKVEQGIFIMNGGSIHDNTTYNHGGAILVQSNSVMLHGGKIYNNASQTLGGGIYVEGDSPAFSYTLNLYNVAITDNKAIRTSAASIWGKAPTGGGVWSCPVGGSIILNWDYGYIIDGNRVERVANDTNANKGYGNDLYACGGYGSTELTNLEYGWWDENSDEARINWSNTAYEIGDWSLSDPSLYAAAPHEGVTSGEVALSHGELMHSDGNTIIDHSGYDELGVQIYGNTAKHGGGVAANGTLVFGYPHDSTRYNAKLNVRKTWQTSSTEPITLQVRYDDGEKQKVIDSCTVDMDGTEDKVTTALTSAETEKTDDKNWNATIFIPESVTIDGEVLPCYTFADPDDPSAELSPVTDLNRIGKIVSVGGQLTIKNWYIDIVELIDGKVSDRYLLNKGNVSINTDFAETPSYYYDATGQLIDTVLLPGGTKHTYFVDTIMSQTITNKPEGVTIIKKNADGTLFLPGAEFTVSGNGIEKTVTTDRNGKARLGLPAGTYTVTEVKPPAGYLMNSTPQTVTISDDEETVTFHDEQDESYQFVSKGNISLEKTDKDTGSAIANVEFGLFENDVEIDRFTTDSQGKATLELPRGNYTIKEITPREGYQANDTEYPVNVATAGEWFSEYRPITEISVYKAGEVYYANGRNADGEGVGGYPVYCLYDFGSLNDTTGIGDNLTSRTWQQWAVNANPKPANQYKYWYPSMSYETDMAVYGGDIEGVMLGGYPNDALGLKAKYDLTVEELFEVSQYALWGLLHKDNATYQAKAEAKGWEDAYDEIINYATGDYSVLQEEFGSNLWSYRGQLSIYYQNPNYAPFLSTASPKLTDITLDVENERKKYDLTVNKIVDGEQTNKNFDFFAEFDGLAAGKTYSYTAGSVTLNFTANGDGKAAVYFTLKDHQTAVFNDIPIGATVDITETEDDDYEPTISWAKANGEELGSKNDWSGEFNLTGDTTVTMTNKDIVLPEVEKYINNNVTLDLPAYQLGNAFEYEIMAFVPEYANSLVITDELSPLLEFANNNSVYVEDMGLENNHSTTVSRRGERIYDGVSTLFTNDKLTVTISDADNYTNHWIKVCFFAKINENDYGKIIDDYLRGDTTVRHEWESVDADDNGPVQIYRYHTGVPNEATYTVNNKYTVNTNVVTVKPKMHTYTLTIKKQVEGNLANKFEEFNFSVKIFNESTNESLNLSSYGGVLNSNTNTYTFKLKHNDEVEIENIPDGYKYEIFEQDYSSKGYITKINDVDGSSVDGLIEEDVELVFTNISNALVPTNITKTISLVVILVCVLIIFSLILLRRVRNKYEVK